MRRLVPRTALAATFAILTACGVGQPTSEPKNTAEPAFVRLPKSVLTPELVQATGFNRDHARHDEFAFGYLNRDALALLTDELGSKVVELDPVAFAKGELVEEGLDPDLPPAADEFEDYHDYAALTAELENLVAARPDLARLASAGQSLGGRELWYLEVSDNVDVDEHEPKLLYIANMHGDETVGRELMIYLLRRLVHDYGTDARITNLVDNARLFIMPSMNPDGFERARRANNNGYDLNRNFPDFTSDPRDVPTGRQPETRAVMALHEEHHFAAALNFHGGAVCFNMPWDTKSNRSPADRFGDDALMNTIAREYADSNASMRNGGFDRGVTYGYEWYEVNGGMQDWSIYYRRSFHATVELSSVKYPSARYLPGYWAENEEALIRFLERGIFGVHVEVTDQDGHPIARPTIAVASSGRTVTFDDHRASRPTLPGAQLVTVSAEGYEPIQVTLEARSFDGTFDRVTLAPSR